MTDYLTSMSERRPVTAIPPAPVLPSQKLMDIIVPVSLLVAGATCVSVAIGMLVTRKAPMRRIATYEVENYDVVADKPFIYGICE